MVQYHGPVPLSSTIVQYLGPVPWSSTIVQYHGPVPWSSTMVQYHGPVPLVKILSQECFWNYKYLYLKKCKSVPLRVWSGPEGSRKLRFPDFMTTTQDGGKVVSLTHWPPLPPGNTPGTHFCWRLSRPQGHSAIGRDRTSDLPICSTAR